MAFSTENDPTNKETAGDPRAGAVQGVIVAASAFFPILAILSLAPAVPSLLQHFKDVPGSATLVPMMVTAPGLMMAFLSPLAGWATDRFGRRRPLLIAVFAYGLFGIAPLVTDSLWGIVFLRFGVGVCEAMILTVVNTLFADYWDQTGRRKWLTVQNIIGPISATLVIMASGLLTERQWNGAFLIYASAFVIWIMMVMFIFEPNVNPRGQEMHGAPETMPFPWKSVALFCGVTLFSSSVFYVFIVNGGFAFNALGEASSARIGMLMAIASVGNIVGAILFGVISKGLATSRMIALFNLLMGVGMVGMGLAKSIAVMTACAFVQQIGAGMAVPPLILWVSRVMLPEHRGRGMGFWVCAFFLGQFLSPAVVTMVRVFTSDVLGAFVALGAVAMLGAVLIIGIGKKQVDAKPADAAGAA